MRVLFYSTSRVWSGAARAFATAALGFARRGHEVCVACLSESAVEPRLDYGAYRIAALGSAPPRPAAVRALRRTLAEHGTEVLFVHTEREQVAAAAAVRLNGRGAIVRRISHDSPADLRPAGRLALWIAATGFLFGSDQELRRSRATRHAAFGPLVTPLGVDAPAYDAIRPLARATIGAGGTTKLIVCTYDPPSRIRAAAALRVAGVLSARHPELRLALVGAGSDAEDLRVHAAALGITDMVSFLGERDDYLSVLRAADLGWVVTAGDEAAYSFLDLHALKVPVLAERTPLAQQYVADNITGVLLPSDDVPAAAAAVARLLAHDEQRSLMGQAGRSRVARDFTEGATLDGFERAALLAGERARR